MKHEWKYQFDRGGWSTVLANTKEEAIALATAEWEWKNNVYLQIDVNSFQLVTTDDNLITNIK